MTVKRSVMLGCGSYLPSKVLTNEDLARKIDTSDEWIVQRTGIHERRIAAPGELTSHMAVRAAQAALAHAHVEAQSIDLIVLATSTPDNTFPGQRRLGTGRSWHHSRRRLRSAGGVFRLRLWAGDGRRLPPVGRFFARSGDRRGDVFAHSRLDRSRHLRAVR